MASLHGKPLKENEEGEDMNDDYNEEADSGCGCGCLRLLGFKQRQSNDNESKYLLQQKGEHMETWWVEKLNKVKEVTEVLAGPKWKTFIRKISGFGINKKQKKRFQYDSQSYALNFDTGFDREEDGLVLDFTSRYAAPFHDEQRQAGSGR